MTYENINSPEFWEKVRAGANELRDRFLRPDGCTCDPPAKLVYDTHDEVTLLVDPRCGAHLALFEALPKVEVPVDTPLAREWTKEPTVPVDEWEGTKR